MAGSRKAKARVSRFKTRSGARGGAIPVDPQSGRSTVVLSPAVTLAVRRMGAAMGRIGPADVVRRGLILLDLLLNLDTDEEMVIRNRVTGDCDRLRFTWEGAEERAHPLARRRVSGGRGR